MDPMGRLQNIETLEQLLVLMQTDEEEFLPDAGVVADGGIDRDIFEKDVHQRLQKMIAANPVLSAEWQNRVLATLKNLRQEGSAKGPQAIYNLALGSLLLRQLEGKSEANDLPLGFGPIPPGFHTASTLSVALMMFQPDEDEETMDIGLEQGESLDLGILKKENSARSAFEGMLVKNPLLQKLWNNNVIPVADYFLQPRHNIDGNPDVVTIEELRTAYGPKEEARNNAIAQLKLGTEILRSVEADQRSWIDRKALKLKSAKKVLGGQGDDHLSSIPALWFHLFAQQTSVQSILGDSLYSYLLNGGFEKNDRVSYRELAELAEIEGFEKGLLTKMFYGLNEEGRKKVKELLEKLQESASYLEFEYSRDGSVWSVFFYADTATPFVEIAIGQEDHAATVIRTSGADGTAKPLVSLVVQNPAGYSSLFLKRLLLAIDMYLSNDQKFGREKKVLEALIQL